MKIEKNEVADGIFSLKFQSQYDVASTFMRLQEFYESPYKNLRHRYFSLEECMDTYAKGVGNFRYTLDWAGFNVPGKIVRNFFYLFESDFLVKENNLFNIINDEMQNEKDFYLIGHSEEINDKVTEANIFSVLAHEVAHGKYYLNANYKKQACSLIRQYPEVSKKLAIALLKMGYTRSVINDEIQAYFATSEPDHLKKKFKINKKDIPKDFNKLFRQFI